MRGSGDFFLFFWTPEVWFGLEEDMFGNLVSLGVFGLFFGWCFEEFLCDLM